jgi:hypothetical protein
LSGIRTHDPSVRASEVCSCFRSPTVSGLHITSKNTVFVCENPEKLMKTMLDGPYTGMPSSTLTFDGLVFLCCFVLVVTLPGTHSLSEILISVELFLFRNRRERIRYQFQIIEFKIVTTLPLVLKPCLQVQFTETVTHDLRIPSYFLQDCVFVPLPLQYRHILTQGSRINLQKSSESSPELISKNSDNGILFLATPALWICPLSYILNQDTTFWKLFC